MTDDDESRSVLCARINQELDELSRQTAVPLRAWLVAEHEQTEANIAYARAVIQQACDQLAGRR